MSDIRLPHQATDGSPAAPWGHSEAAHRDLGWCSHCPDHSPAEEVVEWRIRANREHDARQAALAASAAARHSHLTVTAHQNKRCPGCGAEALVIVTALLAEGRTRRQVGGWAYCEACDMTPAACYCQPGDRPYLAVPAPTEEETPHG